MRFRTRAFLLCFVPFALLLTGSFWAVQRMVKSTVRDGLRTSLRENQLSIAHVQARSDLRNSRFLKVVGENAALKAGLQLLLSYPGNAAARRTVEDQLQDLCQQMGFDFLMFSDSRGTPFAGVIRTDTGLAPLKAPIVPVRQGLTMEEGRVYQVASVPIDQGEDNIGELSVGERFDFSGFSTPMVLTRNGEVIESNIPGTERSKIEAALRGCGGKTECDVRLGGVDYLSLAVEGSGSGKNPGDGYTLRSLQNADSAASAVQTVLNRVFLLAAMGIVLVALVFSVVSSRSIVKPIASVISHLRKSEGTGLLPEFEKELSSIREINDLTAGFNRAAGAIREARRNLQGAYVEFVESLAGALDARDRYTAGHSGRVSQLACATAIPLGITGNDLEDIRVGALLHDIGKIGIPDAVLQKPGKLTSEEFDLIKEHPEIGRRILEGVHGFARYLDVVELHHENWDGTGYPKGQSGTATPLAARIVHVCDAYDAMTTDRPYRQGMNHEKAISVLREFAGTQFDPRVVEVFMGVVASCAGHRWPAALTALNHCVSAGSSRSGEMPETASPETQEPELAGLSKV
ncbi:MAG TPA: HD-GYP domain-containing protein [Bryobacteraceae bacterium]|jgi:putative nucleotidyltransferase with HDIG domain|nr:HD-GYP domain-containing protein [Bryobacteraceae bacterium]